MKSKFNWGHGIALTLLLFVIFIGSFVYKTFMKSEYDYKLTSPNYYEEELKYQEEIDSQKNAKLLTKRIAIKKSEKGLEFVFPPELDYKKVSGHIKLLRNTKDGIDIEKDFVLTNASLIIQDELLAPGRYNLKMKWIYDGTHYQFRDKIDY